MANEKNYPIDDMRQLLESMEKSTIKGFIKCQDPSSAENIWSAKVLVDESIGILSDIERDVNERSNK